MLGFRTGGVRLGKSLEYAGIHEDMGLSRANGRGDVYFRYLSMGQSDLPISGFWA